MSILFSDIYTKAIALFDDPKISTAYNTNRIQFYKIMYTYLQNSISMFTNPASVGIKLVNYNEPVGVMETFENKEGEANNIFLLSPEFEILDNSSYCFMENNQYVNGELNKETRQVVFPDVLPAGQQYAIEQYYVGEFLDSTFNLSNKTNAGNKLIVEEVKDILARLLVKAWAEEEKNLLLDIRNLMQDSDFKINGNDRVLKAKIEWVDQLDTDILSLQNKLAWNIRFMGSSLNIGRG